MPRVRTVIVDMLLRGAVLLRRGSGLLSTLAFGICDLVELRTRNLRYYEQLENFMTAEHIQSGLMDWEQEAYSRYLPTNGTIGLIGCGAGRDVLGLLERGYAVDGVDASEKCIELALRHLESSGYEAELFAADISSFEFPRQAYDTFIFSWFTYNHIPDASVRIRILDRLRRRLASDGIVLLTLPGPAELPQSPKRWITRLAAKVSRNQNPPDSKDRFLVRSLQDGGLLYMRAIDQDDIVSEAGAAGLRLIHFEHMGEGESIVAVLSSCQPAASKLSRAYPVCSD